MQLNALWPKLLLMSLILHLSGCHFWDSIPGNVEKGELDLRSWDGRKPINLTGEWMFFWDEELSPHQVRERMAKGQVAMARSGLTFDTVNGGKGEKGVATYALRIKLKRLVYEIIFDEVKPLGSGKITTSCLSDNNTVLENRAFVDWVEFHSGRSSPLERSSALNFSFSPALEQDCLIVVNVMNWKQQTGGLWFSGFVSRAQDARLTRDVRYILFGTLIGIIFYVATIHFLYWIRQRRDLTHLYLVLCCIFALSNVVTFIRLGEIYYNFFDQVLYDFNNTNRMFLFSASGFGFAVNGLIRGLFNLPRRSIFLRVSFWVFLAVFIVSFVLDSNLASHLLAPVILLNLLQTVVIAVYCIGAFLKKEPESGKLIFGFMAWILMVSYSIYVLYWVPLEEPIFDLFGFGIFLLFQSQIIAARYAATAKENIRLLGEIKEQEKARTLFFHNSSHELRTPLNGIIGFLDLLQGGQVGELNAKAQDYIRKSLRLAESLKNQVNTILDLAKSRRGELQLMAIHINLNDLKKDADGLAEGLLLKHPRSSYTSYLDKTGKDLDFVGDRDKVFAIIRNLLGNAFKFTREGSNNAVHMDFIRTTAGLEIIVRDEGIGIPQEEQSRIFEEFAQVAGDARRAYEGSGLGLSMVRDFVKLMGGEIELQSTVGVGSSFRVKIPEQSAVSLDVSQPSNSFVQLPAATLANIRPAIAKALPTVNPNLLAQHQRYRILVVDDHAVNCEVLSAILLGDGYQVLTAEGGRQALDLTRREMPDLILLDMMMPEVSGEDVLRAIRADETLQEIPVILITARASEEDRIFGLTLGADDYIAKPIISDEVRLRVHNLLLRLEKQGENRELEQRERMAQLGQFFSDLSHEVKNIYQGSDVFPILDDERRRHLLTPYAMSQQSAADWVAMMASSFDSDGMASKLEKMPLPAHPAKDVMRSLRVLRDQLACSELDEASLEKIWPELLTKDSQRILSLQNLISMTKDYMSLRNVNNRGEELVMTILNYGHKSDRTECEVHKTIQVILELSRIKAKRNSCEIRCHIDPAVLPIDLGSLQQIMLNLILNAIDAMASIPEAERWIEIRGQVQNLGYALTVSNAGPKIDPTAMPRLFERGFTTKGRDGSGIGLYISRRMAHRAGGDLTITGDGPHTVFVLSWKSLPKKSSGL